MLTCVNKAEGVVVGSGQGERDVQMLIYSRKVHRVGLILMRVFEKLRESENF